jgi:hypothetical protein
MVVVTANSRENKMVKIDMSVVITALLLGITVGIMNNIERGVLFIEKNCNCFVIDYVIYSNIDFNSVICITLWNEV